MSDDAHTSGTHFDPEAFLHRLDAMFDAHDDANDIERFLLDSLERTRTGHDDAGELTVLNELLGFYRSQGRHADNMPLVPTTLALAERMGLQDTDTWTTTLINAATAMRAAKRHDDAGRLYRQALESAERTLRPDDRRLAALHNNLSMLYSETGRAEDAATELRMALNVLLRSSTDPDTDIDVAATRTNLALVLLDMRRFADARREAAASLRIYSRGGLENSGHFSSALAGYAQACFLDGDVAEAVLAYRLSLAVIRDCYGTDTEYYRITADNLNRALETARRSGTPIAGTDVPRDAAGFRGQLKPFRNGIETAAAPTPTVPEPAKAREPITGLELAKRYWLAYGKPLIEQRYPEYRGRIAAGLVGHGSECYGFDDELSHDHDFGPRFCLWLTDEDYAAIGERLQHDVDALPKEFMGYALTADDRTPRARGAGRRDGVFAIGDFFESITGYRTAPPDDAAHAHQWLMLDEATLAAATNGRVFADPLGAFSATRQGFKSMPDDVRLALISRRLGMMAQSGQYNVPRMLRRGDGAAAWLSIGEFVDATASLVFLLNQPISVGYLPYYKWRFAAMRRLSRRMASRLPQVCGQLESLLRLASSACFGGRGFGEGSKGARPAIDEVEGTIDDVCAHVVDELLAEGLTRSDERFLEWQRPYVEEHIADPWLKSL